MYSKNKSIIIAFLIVSLIAVLLTLIFFMFVAYIFADPKEYGSVATLPFSVLTSLGGRQ